MFRTLTLLLFLLVPALADARVVQYTIPSKGEAVPGACDTVAQMCAPRPSNPTQDSCWTVHSTHVENPSLTRVHWWPRYAPAPYLMREKSVLGRAGQADTLRVPDSPEATMWVSVVDVAGNVSCGSNLITVNIPTTAVKDPPFWVGPGAEVRVFDIAGRRVRPPLASGIYLQRWYQYGVALGAARPLLVLR